MKKYTLTIVLALVLLVGIFSYNLIYRTATGNDNELQAAAAIGDENVDAKFVKEAAECGMLEARLAQLAQSNATFPEVRELANRLFNDHTKINEELKFMAVKKKITVPQILGSKKQDDYDDISKKDLGKDFDEAFCDKMVKEHKNDIDLYEKEADRGKDTELKSWASRKLPTLREHLRLSEEAQDALKNKERDDKASVKNK